MALFALLQRDNAKRRRYVLFYENLFSLVFFFFFFFFLLNASCVLERVKDGHS